MKSGWLAKTGSSGTKFSKRFFKMTNDCIYYFKSESATKQAGQIVISDIKNIVTDSDADTEGCFVFKIRTPDRTYTISAERDLQRTSWIHAILKLLPEGTQEAWAHQYAVVKEGWLEKEGGSNKALKRRYVTLSRESLAYYKAEGDQDPAGEILIDDVQKVAISERPGGPIGALEVSVVGRVYYLVAENMRVRDDWVAAIADLLPAARNKIFGAEIEDAVARRPSSDASLPAVVEDCLATFTDAQLGTEGFLRLSGSANEIQKHKQAYDSGAGVSLPTNDADTVAGLFKLYVRELPSPPVPYDLYPFFISLDIASDERYMIEFARALIRDIPVYKQCLLKAIFPFMKKVASFEATSKMSASNVAIVFAPNLLRARNETPMEALANTQRVTESVANLIPHSDRLFKRSKKPALAIAKAVYDFDARSDTEVTVRAKSSQYLLVTKLDCGAPGWVEVMLESQSGFVPETHVEIIYEFEYAQEFNRPEETTTSSAPPPSSSTTTTTAAAAVGVGAGAVGIGAVAAAAAAKPKPKPAPRPSPAAKPKPAPRPPVAERPDSYSRTASTPPPLASKPKPDLPRPRRTSEPPVSQGSGGPGVEQLQARVKALEDLVATLVGRIEVLEGR